jgi:hypothetical protein
VLKFDGSLQLFLLIGFNICLESEDANLGDFNLAAGSVLHDPSVISAGNIMSAVSAAETGDVRVVLYMSEPDPGDTSTWITWFDELTMAVSALKTIVAKE